MRRVRGAIGGIVLSLGAASHVRAADVFMSIGPDGNTRYATQALDASYRLAYRELSAPVVAPTHAAAAKPNPRSAHLRPIIERLAHHHGVSPALVEAIVTVESNLNAGAISPKGARGAMQLMPATGARYGLGGEAWRDPERNIDAGVRHFKDLLAQHGGNVALALAAYNAGAGAVSRHRGRIPPYRETMLYVPAVLARSTTPSVP